MRCTSFDFILISDQDRFLANQCPYCGDPRNDVIMLGRDRLLENASDYELLCCQSCRGWFTSGSGFASMEEYYRVAYPPEYHDTFSGGRDGNRGSNPDVADTLRCFLSDRDSPSLVLDVGCGNGGFLNHLRSLGLRVAGVEINEHAAAYCTHCYGVDVFNGTLDQYTPTEQFDAITILGTLEHFPNPIRTLSAAKRMLKMDGVLIFDYPNVDSLESRIVGSRWWGLDLPRHLLHLRGRDVNLIVDRSGLVCIKQYGVVRTWLHNSYLSPPQLDGIPRKSLLGSSIMAIAGLFIFARMKPLTVCVCRPRP